MTPRDATGSALTSAAGGTPKRGYGCSVCLDWGTVTVVEAVGDGVTVTRTIPCPKHPAPADGDAERADQAVTW